MKYFNIAWLAAFSAASPYKPLETRNRIARRQASDACSIGYCTEAGGTTGGVAGDTITVTNVDSLARAAGQEEPLTIIVSGTILGSAKVHVSANKTIFGENGSSITGVGFYIHRARNVIVRNMKIAKVAAQNGDAIGIDASSNIWIDHCDLSGDLNSGKDDYDGLVDISHGSQWVTISNTYFHDHWKASLIGHSDRNAKEDQGTLHVTYAGNQFYRTYSRAPLVRFGTVHIVNNFWDTLVSSGVNCRMGAQVLIQSSAFKNSSERAVFFADSTEPGYAILDDVDLGGSENSAPVGTLTVSSLPYAPIETLGSAAVTGIIPNTAGQKL
ncbi:polysaccharide lyase family 1 protein [Annulohypoxylon maeteangense]|uniref:polysaccharide lyase family 1 protein n=1 Tax=Annulohypoxylon maeteangense TaxID=1927788 RepID=UPI0020088149|nr:polysaccharide lyase family 1 protein [Annulohypoxylon maeteangense]KAI0879854.1 polysaccharide lyase family 1 protein [Annulohypoxylon maeteangense]